jgi:ABC-2 type transport system permease protein
MMAILIFGLIPKGSMILLMFLSIFFITGNLAAGLTISTYAQTQQQAVYMVMFYMMPTMLLSGYLFPIISMPSWVQKITYILPLRYYLVILRGIIIKGATLNNILFEFTALVIYSVAMIIFASIRFRKYVG